jgi:hypothetical protein
LHHFSSPQVIPSSWPRPAQAATECTEGEGLPLAERPRLTLLCVGRHQPTPSRHHGQQGRDRDEHERRPGDEESRGRPRQIGACAEQEDASGETEGEERDHVTPFFFSAARASRRFSFRECLESK